MKKAKDIVDKIQQFGTSNQNFWYVKPNDVISAIKQAQIDAIDEAVRRCAEEAELAFADGYEIPDYCEEPFNCTKNEVGDAWYIERESILQVADKLKIEL